jgi:hypothetical protein
MGSNKPLQPETGPAIGPSDLDYMALQVGVLYRLDGAGRLRCINEAHEPPAPRFFIGRTQHGNLWRFRHDLPGELCQELERLCAAEPVTTDFTDPPVHATAIKGALANYAPVINEYRGPAYWIPASYLVPSHVVLITDANQYLLLPGFPEMAPTTGANGPVVAAVVDGTAVAVCHTARITAAAAEAGVKTLLDSRGQGHATAAVAEWAAAIRQSGRLPLYSTWWENHASQGVALKLGMVFYGEDWSLG